MNQIKLGKFISDIRNERKMTQDELAEKIGVSSGKIISKWECGNSMPDFETIIEISKALNITLYELSICKKIDNPKLTDKAKNTFITYKQLVKSNIKNKIIVILAVTLGILFGLSTIFTFSNYKKIEMYQFYYSPSETKYTIEGNIFVTKNEAYFNVIKIDNIEEDNDYLNIHISNIQFEVLDKEDRRVLLYNYNKKGNELNKYNLLQIIKSSSFSQKIDKAKIPKDPNLKLKIAYIDDNRIPGEIIIEFKIDKIYENTL